MELKDAIFGRASVRSFTDEPVENEQVERLLRAAMAAPSACNQQPWEFVATRDAARRRALAQASPYAGPAAGAAVVVALCARTEGLRVPDRVSHDLGAAMENLLLAAVDEGLGAVWLGIGPDPERMGAVARALDIPAQLAPFALAAIGHPAVTPKPTGADRFDADRIHWRGAAGSSDDEVLGSGKAATACGAAR